MNFQILPAKPSQADILTQIAVSAKAHWGYPERWMELWQPQLTFGPGYFSENESWVAEIDQVPVGFYTLLEKDGKAWIENLFVSPEAMGQGVGRRLFLHALDRSRQGGFENLRLEADPNAVGFYERMGMKKMGEHRYEIEGRPRILPILEIQL